MLLDYYILRFLFTFKWRSQSKEDRIGSGSFLIHFKSNNTSKVKKKTKNRTEHLIEKEE